MSAANWQSAKGQSEPEITQPSQPVCGVTWRADRRGKQLRCTHDRDHEGEHSYVAHPTYRDFMTSQGLAHLLNDAPAAEGLRRLPVSASPPQSAPAIATPQTLTAEQVLEKYGPDAHRAYLDARANPRPINGAATSVPFTSSVHATPDHRKTTTVQQLTKEDIEQCKDHKIDHATFAAMKASTKLAEEDERVIELHGQSRDLFLAIKVRNAVQDQRGW